jgi:DNA replication and repair protein RecF
LLPGVDRSRVLITRLQLRDVRRIAQAELCPAAGFNLLTGPNGSGKTSVLEALHVLAHGRSFRGRVRDGLIRKGAAALEVFVEFRARGSAHRAGLRHAGGSWDARLDGSSVAQLGDLCAALAVVSFEPGSHALVDGGGEQRRRYLDWGLFHVERGGVGDDFLATWRRYTRALKQRNAMLRSGRSAPSQLDAWEHELALHGEHLTAQRELYVGQLQTALQPLLAQLLPAAGDVQLGLQPGWRRGDLALADALLLARDRDLAAGHTSVGPHRADLRIELSALPSADTLSRGQTKLLALCLLLAQAGQLAAHAGAWPVLQLDDLGSELDRDHQSRVLQVLARSGAQVLLTGTEPTPALLAAGIDCAVFHVEHGCVRAE